MKTTSLLAALAALALAALAGAQTPAAPATPAPLTAADAPALHQQGIERLQQKNAKEAVEFAEKATKADPTKPEYFSQLGIALSQRMNEVPFTQMAMLSVKMKKAFEKSIALDPKHLTGLIGLARFYTNAPEIAGGSLEKAKEFADRVRALDELLGEIELGHVAFKGEDYAGALPHYQAAVALKPENPGLRNICGQTLAKLGHKDEARAQFEAALKLKPDFEAAKKALAELDAPAAPEATTAAPTPKG